MSISKTNSFHCMRQKFYNANFDDFLQLCSASIFQVKREPYVNVTFESIRNELVGKISFVIVSKVL